eukprot:Skav205590  [mRNA]  locus=scaffold460:115114:115732:+ [translate_table: standard]
MLTPRLKPCTHGVRRADGSRAGTDKAGADFQSAEFKENGKIIEFAGIQDSCELIMKEIEALEVLNAHQTLLGAVKRSLFVRKISEEIFCYSVDGGLLKTPCFAKIKTVRKANNKRDILIAWFELSLAKPINISHISQLGGVSQLQEQLDALSNFVKARAVNYWKKLQADKGDVDDDDTE